MIVDAHTHVGLGSSYLGRGPSREFNGDDLVAIMDQEGIDRAVCFGLGHTGPTEGVRYTIDAIQRHPDRLIGFFRANPYSPTAVKDFERAVKEYGFKGLKLHPISEGFPANHPVVFALLEKATELGVPCTIHSHQYGTAGAGSQPAIIAELAEQFPKLTIILAHMGMYLYRDALYVAQHHPNIVLETSAQPWTHRIARLAVDRVGPERLIFGSDTPLHHPRVELLKMRSSDLEGSELDLALGGNILRILGMAG